MQRREPEVSTRLQKKKSNLDKKENSETGVAEPTKTVEISFWKPSFRDHEMQGDDGQKESEPDVGYVLTQARE